MLNAEGCDFTLQNSTRLKIRSDIISLPHALKINLELLPIVEVSDITPLCET